MLLCRSLISDGAFEAGMGPDWGNVIWDEGVRRRAEMAPAGCSLVNASGLSGFSLQPEASGSPPCGGRLCHVAGSEFYPRPALQALQGGPIPPSVSFEVMA